MQTSIADAVVVVTGASSGIGRATALAIARRGGTVVVAARRDEPLRDVVAECERLGGRAIDVVTDVTDDAAVEALARRAVEEFGRIDAWVNNAAVTLLGRFEESPPDVWRKVVDTNLFGYVNGARAALPRFRQAGGGVLINVASMASKMGQPYASAYVASKFAIRGFAESLRQELALEGARGIHVCTVMPAVVDTPLFQHAANYSGRAVKAMNPVHEAEQVAETIVALIERPRRQVMVGAPGRLMAIMHTFLPGLAERQLASMVDRDHFADYPAAPTPGNVFTPMAEGTEVSGGWTSPTGSRSPLAIAAGGLALGVPALLAWRARRRRTRLPLVGSVALPGARRRRRRARWAVPAALAGMMAMRARRVEAPELPKLGGQRRLAGLLR